MKTVTQDFLDAQGKHALKYFREITMYRRYWDVGSGAYVWEATGTDLLPYFVAIDNINWQLDTEGLNVWKAANLQLTLKNSRSEFNEAGLGFFDSTYIRHKTKIEVQVGYYLADGSTETVYNFAGFIDKDVRTDMKSGAIVLTLMGREVLLAQANAENVCNKVTGETIGTGDDTEVDFYTVFKGVGALSAVYLDGVALVEGKDYTVSQLNDLDNYAKISFNIAPSVAQAITCDYGHWYKNIAIGTVVGYLFDEAGFPAAQRTIDSIVGSGRKYKNWDTKAEFEATATRSRNIDTVSVAGNVQHKIEDLTNDTTRNNITVSGVYPNQTANISLLNWRNVYNCSELPTDTNPVWTDQIYSAQDMALHEINPAGILHMRTNSGGSYTDAGWKRAVATKTMILSLKLAVTTSSSNNTNYECFWTRIDDGSHKADVFIYYNPALDIWRISVGATPQIHAGKIWNDYKTLWICMDAGGTVSVYIDGALVGTDSAEASSADICQFIIRRLDPAIDYVDAYIDYIKDDDDYVEWTTSSSTGTLTSTVIDLGDATLNIGTILRRWTDPGDGSTLLIETQTSGTSDFTSDNDSWRTVSFVGNIGTVHASTIAKRYIRWRTTLAAVASLNVVLDELAFPGHMLSETIDCTANIIALDLWQDWGANNNGAYTIYSQSSTNGSTWDSEQVVTAGAIVSTVRRYIRFRTMMYRTATGTTPKIFKQKLTYTLSNFNIALADFSGMTVQSAIEDLAEMLDYEIGVDTEGKSFFRRKNTSTDIDLQLADDTNILSIDNFDSGWNRVKNLIVATWGAYSRTISPKTEGATAPDSIDTYGTLQLSISGGDIIVDADLDLAYGIAETYYARYKSPKKRFRVKCKMLPQVELGDTVNVNYLAEQWMWWWGKQDVHFGKHDLFYFNNSAISIRNLLCNVIGIEIDLTNWVMYLKVREI